MSEAGGGEYLVSYGRSGAVGRFVAALSDLRRGVRVVVAGPRGVEIGVVLCSATPRHVRLLPGGRTGSLLRRAGPDDESTAKQRRALGDQLFADGRRLAAELHLPLEILDAEVLLDGRRAVVQHLRWAECDYEPFAAALQGAHGVEVLFEDLAVPTAPDEESDGGCGEPGCGRAEGGRGCTSCGTDGGCGSCGTGKVDMRAYFAHLREKMEQQPQRTPLL